MSRSFTSNDVLEGARTIRAYLPEMLDQEAQQVDQQLSDLLAQAKSGEDVGQEILGLLKGHEGTYHWMAEFLSSHSVSKGFEALPGRSSSISARKFICPEGDYVWYQRSVGSPVPRCPTHGELIPVDEK